MSHGDEPDVSLVAKLTVATLVVSPVRVTSIATELVVLSFALTVVLVNWIVLTVDARGVNVTSAAFVRLRGISSEV
jgi:hypothetical protein